MDPAKNELDGLPDSVRSYAVTLFKIRRERGILDAQEKSVSDIVKKRGFDPDDLVGKVQRSFTPDGE